MSSSEDTFKNVHTITETYKRLLDDAAHGRISVEELRQELKKTEITIFAPGVNIQELKHRLEIQQNTQQLSPSNTTSSSSQPRIERTAREATLALGGPDSIQMPNNGDQRRDPNHQAPQNHLSSVDANEEVAWARLHAKLRQIHSDHPSNGSMDEIISELPFVPPSSSNLTIPSSVLAIAPHLATRPQDPTLDKHILQTQKLQQAFSSEKAINPIINIMQTQCLPDPIPCIIWRKIIQDDYADFEHLYGSTDRNYTHLDDQNLFTRKPIKTEAEWTRMFMAWEAAVLLLYPHRREELQNYRSSIVDLFRVAPDDPSIAIQLDVEARRCYARSPFHLDNKHTHLLLLSQLLHGSNSGLKRNSDSSSSGPSKRAAVPCQKWNLGICNDPCPNRRKHKVCSECGGQHKAMDIDGCRTKLQDKRRRMRSGHWKQSRKGLVGDSKLNKSTIPPDFVNASYGLRSDPENARSPADMNTEFA